MIKSKKGFTLVELCVVLALIGIVVGMATGFLAVYHKNVVNINSKGKTMSELNVLRSNIGSWLENYDSNDYTVTAYPNYILAEGGGISETLSVSARKLNISGTDPITMDFETIDHCVFSFDEVDSAGNEKCVLRCKAILTDSSYQEIAFSLQAGLVRILEN